MEGSSSGEWVTDDETEEEEETDEDDMSDAPPLPSPGGKNTRDTQSSIGSKDRTEAKIDPTAM